MKTINQISKESGIHKQTLHSRIRLLGLTPKIHGNQYHINQFEEKDILKVNTTSRIKIPKPSKRLIFEFKENYPIISNLEIAETLGINESYVNNILGTEFLILESKMNFKK